MYRFFKDFMIYGLASVIGKIAAVLLIPVYTSILTKEEYGAIALLTSCKGIIDIISNLNIHSGIARDYYEEGIDRKRLVSTGFISILSLAFSILVFLLLTYKFWTGTVLGLNEKYYLAFVVMLCTIPSGSLQSYFAILTRYKKKPILYSIGTLLHLIIQVGISILGIVVLRKGIVSVFIATLAAELFSIFFYAYINREYISCQFDKSYLKKALLFSIPTLPAILAGWIDNSFGQIFIGKYISMENLGVYSLALQLSSVFSLVGIALNNVWSPYVYENYKKESFQLGIKKIFSLFALLLIFISCTLSLFSNEFILLLSNRDYIEASKYVPILCVPMSFYLLFPFASSGISISRDTKYISISYMIGSTLNLIVLFMLIEFLGIYAILLGLVMSRVVTYMMLYNVSEKKIKYQLPNYLLLSLLFVVLLCYMINIYNLSLIIRSIVELIVFISLLYYLSKIYDIKSLISAYLGQGG